MKKIIFIMALSFYCLAVNSSTGSTGWRNISNLGCHLSDGTCYFNIDGGPVGLESCLGVNVRFDVQTSANGKVWLSLLQQAYATDKKVSLNISGCYKGSTYPTFNYGTIEK